MCLLKKFNSFISWFNFLINNDDINHNKVREDYFETRYPQHYNNSLKQIKTSLKTTQCLNCGGKTKISFKIKENTDELNVYLICNNDGCPGYLELKTNITEMICVTGAYGYDLDKTVVSKTNPTVVLG